MTANRNHEVTTPHALLDETGNLSEPGWSRQLLQQYDRSAIKAPAFRIKEWDYYLILARDFAVALTISDDGYIGLQSASFLDFKTPFTHTQTVLNVLPMGKLKLPPHSATGITSYEDKRLQMRFEVQDHTRHITCCYKNFYQKTPFICDITLSEPPQESMVIATPFEKEHTFYYNQKINCMRASGYMEFNQQKYEFHPETDYGTLDWGRGVWTYDNTWYWGSGNCTLNGKPFGFNIGYGFGDTTAASENVIFYDGKIHKLADVTFHIPTSHEGSKIKYEYEQPWTFTSSDGRFEMNFEPVIDRAADLNALIIESNQHQVFGRMSGICILDDGTPLTIKDVMCFAERVHNRY